MTKDLKGTVDWLLENLDMQIEDLTFEERNIAVDLYLDTSDVRDAVLGMQAFYTPGVGFNAYMFNQRRTLVQCLAASSWLGKFHMLPPHQAEFLNLLNLDFGVGIERDPRGRAQKFLRAFRVVDVRERKTKSLGNMSKQELYDFIRQQAGSADKFFKAVQCISGTWETRLTRWRESKLFELEPRQNEDYISVLKTKTFHSLKEVFDRKRPDRPMNNFADAAAVTMLVQRVEQFKRGHLEQIPRFFVSTQLFRDAVKEAGVEPLLRYESPLPNKVVEEKFTSVLRDVDYFVFKSTFRPPPEKSVAVRDQGSTLDESLDLRRLRSQVADILTAQRPLTQQAVDRIEISGKPLGKIIEDLQRFVFLENVWLPYFATKDVQAAAKALSRAAQSKKFQCGVGEAISATKEALEENVQEYKWIRSLWTGLEASPTLQIRMPQDTGLPLDVFRDFGLLRFGFPKPTHQRIRDLLEALLSHDEDAEREARISVVTACHEIRKNIKGIRHLAVGAAVLWVAKMDRQLIELLEKIEPLPHYSLKLVYAAAIFRQKYKVKKGHAVLKGLREEYAKTDNPRERANFAVGIAYLSFHLSLCLGFKPTWRHDTGLRPYAANIKMQKLINNAIKYAKEAYDLLSTENMQKVYALNQYLYYLDEGGSDNRIGEMKKAAKELSARKPNRELWQYRFDDTLARYFHRLAASTTDEGTWQTLMKNAKRHIEEAWKDAYGDQEVESYLSILEVEIAAGFLRGDKKY